MSLKTFIQRIKNRRNLGFIPAWQFGLDAQQNPALSPYPFMQYPAGMTQTTTQPVGPYYNAGGGPQGLGAEPVDTMNAVFNSWWWQHRKLIVVGTAVALGVGIVGGVAAIAR